MVISEWVPNIDPHDWQFVKYEAFDNTSGYCYECTMCGWALTAGRSGSMKPDPLLAYRVLIPGKWWVDLECAEYAMWKVNEA